MMGEFEMLKGAKGKKRNYHHQTIPRCNSTTPGGHSADVCVGVH